MTSSLKLGAVFRVKRFKGRGYREKPRYLIYFGSCSSGLIFFTTTTQKQFYEIGKRSKIPFYFFKKRHSCFSQECVLDIKGYYIFTEEEFFDFNPELTGFLKEEEIKECLRVITFDNPDLPEEIYKTLRDLLVKLL